MKINKMLGTQGRFQVKVLRHCVLPEFDQPKLKTLLIFDLHEGDFVGSDQIPFDELSFLLKIRNDDDLQGEIESLNAVVTCAEKNDYSEFFGCVMASVPVGSYDESAAQSFSKFCAFLVDLVERVANPVDAETVAKNTADVAVDDESTLMMFYAPVDAETRTNWREEAEKSLNCIAPNRVGSGGEWFAVMAVCKKLGVPYSVVDAWNRRDPDRYNEKENRMIWDDIKGTGNDNAIKFLSRIMAHQSLCESLGIYKDDELAKNRAASDDNADNDVCPF